MAVEVWPALLAGFIGGLLMTIMRSLLRAAGLSLKLDILRLWGTMLTLHGQTAALAGAAIHLGGSAAIGLLYAWGFRLLGVTDSLWQWGLVGGVIHWLLAGLFMAIVPPLHPELPEQRPAPGAFIRHFGVPDVPVFVIGHLMYGVVVAISYALLHTNGGWDAAL